MRTIHARQIQLIKMHIRKTKKVLLRPKTDEHLKPSVEVRHLVGKLFKAETLLTEVKRKVPTSLGSFLVMFVIRERIYANSVFLKFVYPATAKRFLMIHYIVLP